MGTEIERLEHKSRWVRRVVLESIASSGKGHIGGTYSCVELLVALYYGGVLRFDPRDPRAPDRDRLLIGKGHACLALYAIFMDLGLITAERFASYGRDGGLGGQLDVSVPGVEYNTGSLGHVLGMAAGMALAAKMDGKTYRSWALLGDAECYEGSVWEALTFAGQQGLDRLVAVIDRNRLSVTDVVDESGPFREFAAKVRTFDWDVREIDGHAFPQILDAFRAAEGAKRPLLIVAHTVKGKGVSFMEHGVKWHHGVPTAQELETARRELEAPRG